MASVVHQTRPTTTTTTTFSTNKSFKSASGIPATTRAYNTNSLQIKASSRPSSPRLQQNYQPYSNQLRSTTSPTTTTTAKPLYASSIVNSPSSPTPTMMSAQPSYSSTPAGTIKHGRKLSASSSISYPHPSIHPPLRLLTTATCLDTYTCLVSAQSPPHSPTFTALSLPKSSASSIGSGSRANSILDGIQSAIGGALGSSSPPSSSGALKSSSTYSAAKESLADFSIPASKRSSSNGSQKSNNSGDRMGGVVRSRSNYVSFPNFDEVDFVDVAMVDDNEDDDEDWAGPDSPPEGQQTMMQGDMDEKLMQGSLGAGQPIDPRIGLGMPTSPSQHWLLQLETCHELRVNGGQV
ncbi:hypothetical protein BGZ58_001562 [Dissophora ornata]|nr:hypothetical protein BGZ58_001562 [Dissophora ornata]